MRACHSQQVYHSCSSGQLFWYGMCSWMGMYAHCINLKIQGLQTHLLLLFFLIPSSKRRIWKRSENAEVLGQTISFFFSTAPYAVNIGSFQSSAMTSRCLCGSKRHTDPTKHETWLEVELSHDWCRWKLMEYSALLILHATLGILMLTEHIAFLMPGSFIAAKAIRNPQLLYTMDFLIFTDWKILI